VSPRGGKRPGAGRPATGLTDKLNIRCSPEQKAAWMEAAARAGKPLSTCVLEQLDAWAARK